MAIILHKKHQKTSKLHKCLVAHIQRLKTKLLETNEKLEERDRCIASLRAQCAHDDEERERVTTALRNVTEQQLASVEARNALQDTMMREREEVELGHAELEEEINGYVV